MAYSKNALIRYRAIDKCLQNTSRKWTLNDLIEACSEALYELEGRQEGVSKRTVQLDIETMRGDKLGYCAPIEVYEKKYYRYSDPDYSISRVQLSKFDFEVLSDSIEVLKQFKNFSLFKELHGVLQKIEDKVNVESGNNRPVIHIDKNENLKGLEWIDLLYQAIQKKVVLQLTYQSFRAGQPSTFLFHGYLLKEFNNRWFLIGKKEQHPKIQTLALDRIIKVEFDFQAGYEEEEFDPDEFYKNTYGVTVMTEKQLIKIELLVDRNNAPYVLTKPIHHSQELLEELEDGGIRIRFEVHHNYEIERLILGYGESVEVIKPEFLRRRIQRRISLAEQRYVE
ncbi:MAG: WYL domain-containing protein [Cyclobacteriaceae bacterium]|nr:WYL domain-containing protein [Cyclobacteriaceae bacterium]